MAGCPNEIQAVAATAMEAASDAPVMIPLSDEHLHGITKRLRMWRRFIVLAFDWLKGSGRSGTARDRNGAECDE
jgi:hypothetical protein